MSAQIKVDCHTHTRFSFDGTISPEKYVAAAVRAGLNAVVICDHNRTRGALEVQALDPPFQVIVSEEIMTQQGELIGSFLQEKIPKGRSVSWTIDAIHEQGGLVIVPHPFSRVVPSRISQSALFESAQKIDIVEALNARVERTADEVAALAFARANDCALCAGSDAHLAGSLGKAYVKMPPFTDAKSFLAGLRQGTFFCEKRTPLWMTGISFVAPALRNSLKRFGAGSSRISHTKKAS